MRIRMKPTTASKLLIAAGIGAIALGVYTLFCGVEGSFVFIAGGLLFIPLGYVSLKKAKKQKK